MYVDCRDALTAPDGFFGAVVATEGITDACTVLNAPTGCKLNLGELCKKWFGSSRTPTNLQSCLSDTRWALEFFFKQSRVPCTYLDDYDYVFGPAEKLTYVFPRVADHGYSLIAVLNSPGASLIGDDLQRYIDWAGLSVPAVVLDKPFFSEPFEKGWSESACAIVDKLASEPMPATDLCVNLVGLSIWHKHWANNREELERLLRLCGIGVHCTLMADCTVDQIRRLRSAACNVVVHDELGLPLAEHLAARYEMPYVHSQEGAPLGFDATEAWIRQICQAVAADPSPALQDLAEHRRRAARILHDFTSKTGVPRGIGFGVALDASLAFPLVKWLCDYLAMAPLAVQVPNEEHFLSQRLKEYLQSIGAGDAWNAPLLPDEPPEVLFSNDGVILRLKAHKPSVVGIDLALPGIDPMHFLPRSILGPAGAMWLLERLCNGLWPYQGEKRL